MEKCKFYKQQEQVSYDRGVNYENVVPAQYRKGDLYEEFSEDCADIQRWKLVTNDYICENGSKYEKKVLEISEDGGNTYRFKFPYTITKGSLIESNSIDCNYKWFGKYGPTSNGFDNNYPKKVILCYYHDNVLKSKDISFPSNIYTDALHQLLSGYVGTCVTKIVNGTFSGYDTLSSINIPSSVEYVGDGAFNGCNSLPVEDGIRYADTCAVEAISSISPKAGTRFIHSQYAQNSTYSGSVNIPNSVISIGQSAFENANNLSLSLSSNTLSYVGKSAFNLSPSHAGDGLIGSVNIVGNYQDAIYEATFKNSSVLTDVSFPNGVTSIEKDAFNGCSNLSGITMHSGITSIGENAFYKCNSLPNLIIPSGNTVIGKYAFSDSGIKNINLQSANISDNAFINCKDLESITIGNGSIGINAFESCTNLNSVNLGDVTFEFGGYDDYSPFKYCNNIKHFKINCSEIGAYRILWNSTLQTAEFGPDVERITGDYSFNFDDAVITSLAIVPPILRYNAFVGPISVIYVPLESLEAYKSSTSGNQWSYYFSDIIFPIGSPFITYEATSKLNVYLNNFTPNALEENFNSSNNKGSITFQTGNQQEIGSSAFYGKTELTKMYISSGITIIGSNAFMNCTNLSSVTINNDVTSIGNSTFYNCTSLSSIDIPDSVTSIGNNAFSGCTSLTSIDIPSGVTSISQQAFASCTGLTSCTIGSGVTSIGNYTFQNCYSLSSITIPDSVTSIGVYAFGSCRSLTTCTIGSGVTSIGNYAFNNCSGLTSVTIYATTPPTISNNSVFYNTNDCPIYVPSESVDTYKNALNWGLISSRIQAIP